MRVYVKTDDHRRRQRCIEEIADRLALYRLLRAQRLYGGLDPAEADVELERAILDDEAQRQAPPGTVLFMRTELDILTIWVIAEDGSDIYRGPPSGYVPGP